ncbi:MAG: hypothetical protein IKC44_06720 [Burkholderiaceae bacterium]|nr:hypothetical protein [Burkholderiaceae bacterium]
MKIIQLQGIRSGVGTSFVAAALAYRLSVSNVRVLAVNANPSAFSLDQSFNLPMELFDNWITDVLSGRSVFSHRYRYNELLDVLPAGVDGSGTPIDWNCAIEALLREADGHYDYVVMDAGVMDTSQAAAVRARASIIIDVMEAEANSLMRLIRHRPSSQNEYYLFNKVWPLSRTQSDVSAFIQRYSQFVKRLVPLSVPYDEYALQSSLYKQPITQSMFFSESAEQLNHITTWIKQKLL